MRINQIEDMFTKLLTFAFIGYGKIPLFKEEEHCPFNSDMVLVKKAQKGDDEKQPNLKTGKTVTERGYHNR